MSTKDSELNLLETIYLTQDGSKFPTQRDFAGATGLSLGMVNAMLRRFMDRGWITLRHLSGKKIQYVLTHEGMEEVVQRSVSYFKRTVNNTSMYQKHIESYVRHLAELGYERVVLIGPEEINFLFRYACVQAGLEFLFDPAPKQREWLLAQGRTMFVVANNLAMNDKASYPDDKSTLQVQQADQARLSEVLLYS